jgi:AraC-like DNA-binding protein
MRWNLRKSIGVGAARANLQDVKMRHCDKIGRALSVDMKLSQIARSVGYDSEAAFCHVFRRVSALPRVTIGQLAKSRIAVP